MCGEKSACPSEMRKFVGSPPRVRGEDIPKAQLVIADRITPACAGRSPADRSFSAGVEDHPRVCGEKWQGVVNIFGGLGSPPRVRGEVAVLARAPALVGITPACAGRRLDICTFLLDFEDHPRVCGEKVDVGASSVLRGGSPPRVRGEVPCAR